MADVYSSGDTQQVGLFWYTRLTKSGFFSSQMEKLDYFKKVVVWVNDVT